MSIECAECERDLRGGHDPSCSRHPNNKSAGGARAMSAKVMEALRAIAEMDAHDAPDGFNEWGEAHMFRRAQELARQAIEAADKARSDG